MQAKKLTLLKQPLKALVLTILDEYKGEHIIELEVGHLSSIADHMIICTGTSNRHVKSLASHLIENAKAAGHLIVGVEGSASAEWMLVDLGDIIVHLMQQAPRDFYQLEKLWSR